MGQSGGQPRAVAKGRCPLGLRLDRHPLAGATNTNEAARIHQPGPESTTLVNNPLRYSRTPAAATKSDQFDTYPVDHRSGVKRALNLVSDLGRVR